MTKNYDADSIVALEGLDPVRHRPGMYTDIQNPLHILQEVIDNSVDEALAGYASEIHVRIFKDGHYEVQDNGRGIPCESNSKTKLPAVQMVFSMLHAGGKFNKTEKGNAYTLSGGLHGVGVSVTNALSLSLTATVCRNGKEHQIGFEDGHLTTPLKAIGKSTQTGTKVRFKPNPKYFDTIEVPVKLLESSLMAKAVLSPGLTTSLTIEGEESKVWHFKDGMLDYLRSLCMNLDEIVEPFKFDYYFKEGDHGFNENEGISVAMGFYEGAQELGKSFVNLIPTADHGTHLAGFKQALLGQVKLYAENHAMIPKGVKLSSDDCTENLGFLLSLKMLDPAFQNQTKDRLISRDASKLVEKAASLYLAEWFSKNLDKAKKITELAISAAVSRSKKANKVERKKSSSVVLLPGKLTDCESSNLLENELFLVEGDSAGGSAKMARNRETQAILPLRGKVLNTWEEDAYRALGNREIADISTAIGVELHTPGKGDLSKLRYGKICVLADADVDGSHIQALLLALFLKHLPDLVTAGHIYIAVPPLYRIDTEAQSKKKPAKKIYIMSEIELEQWQERLAKEGYRSVKVGRFKGLGEMDPVELKETTLDREARTLIQVKVDDAKQTNDMMSLLMSSNRSGDRRSWMERRGDEIDATDL